jgi:hypothetical protein
MRGWVIGVFVATVLLAGCTSDDKPVVLSTSTVSTSASSDPRAGSNDFPTTGDHIHIAYGIYVCDQYLPPLQDVTRDVSGIHTHVDGVIHVHPFSDRYAGPNATLEVFGDTVGLELDDGAITLPDGTVLPDDAQCDGAPTELRIFTGSATDPAAGLVPYDSDAEDLHLGLDGGVLVIAAIPPGASTPPPPPSVATLGDLSDLPGPPTTR